MSSFRDWEVWVDYLEDEVDQDFHNELSQLRSNNPELNEKLLQLQSLRAAVKGIEETSIPTDDQYFEGLQGRIMGAIENESMEPRRVAQVKSRFTMRVGVAAALVLLVSGAIFSFMTTSQRSIQTFEAPQPVYSSDWILQMSAEHPEILSETVLALDTDLDVYVDAAAEKLENMKEEDKRKALEELKK